MIVLRLRDAKSVIRSQSEEEVVTEMGGVGTEGSPDISGDIPGELEEMERMFKSLAM
jgi:hypothetical protein